jgi:hypothetical protein
MATPSEVGAATEAAVAAALIRAGKVVYAPLFGSYGRVDLIIDEGVRLVRVQCKTARLVGEVLVFTTCSNTRDERKDYAGQVDVFGVYSSALDQVFLVPVEDVPTRACSLRIAPTRNGQSARVRWAASYALTPTGRGHE